MPSDELAVMTKPQAQQAGRALPDSALDVGAKRGEEVNRAATVRRYRHMADITDPLQRPHVHEVRLTSERVWEEEHRLDEPFND